MILTSWMARAMELAQERERLQAQVDRLQHIIDTVLSDETVPMIVTQLEDRDHCVWLRLSGEVELWISRCDAVGPSQCTCVTPSRLSERLRRERARARHAEQSAIPRGARDRLFDHYKQKAQAGESEAIRRAQGLARRLQRIRDGEERGDVNDVIDRWAR